MGVFMVGTLLFLAGTALAQEASSEEGPVDPAGVHPAPEPEALPDPPPGPGTQAPTPEDTGPEARLSRAIQAYLSGELEEAREAFLLLVADKGLEQSHPQVRREAQVYLGSLDHNLGDRDAARNTYLLILLEDPDFQLDPFAHPPELLAFFDSVRVQAQAMRPIAPPPEAPSKSLNPLLLVVPGGLQLHNGQQMTGLTVLGGVAGLGLLTGALRVRLQTMDVDTDRDGIQVHTEEDKLLAERLKLATQATGWSTLVIWSASFLHGALVSTRSDGTKTVSMVGPNLVVRW